MKYWSSQHPNSRETGYSNVLTLCNPQQIINRHLVLKMEKIGDWLSSHFIPTIENHFSKTNPQSGIIPSRDKIRRVQNLKLPHAHLHLWVAVCKWCPWRAAQLYSSGFPTMPPPLLHLLLHHTPHHTPYPMPPLLLHLMAILQCKNGRRSTKFKNGLKTHPKVVNAKNKRQFHHFWGYWTYIKVVLEFLLGHPTCHKDRHFCQKWPFSGTWGLTAQVSERS